MPSKVKPKLNLFFGSRAPSTFGDEIWAIALPLFFSIAGYSSEQMGSYYSIYAAGTVIGFILLPRLAVQFRVSSIAVFVDALQILIFSLLAFWLMVETTVSIAAFSVCGFFLASATAIWFGSSETLATQIVEKSDAQSFHRLNYLSATIGPLLAPLAASGLYLAIGLIGIAIFNAITFLPQIIAVRSIRPQKIISTSSEKRVHSNFNVLDLLKHPHYGPLLGVTTTVKVGLLGVLPFIPFVFAKMSLSAVSLVVVLAAFSVGSVAGAFFYRARPTTNLDRVFLRDTSGMFLATAVIVIGLKNQMVWIVPVAALIAGLFCARFSIEIRAMRQLISPSNQIPALVSLQGLFSRVVTPLAGVLYGFLFAVSSAATFSYVVASLILLSGITHSYFAARGFKKTVQLTEEAK